MANLKLGVTIGGNIALHSGNYNNYAPTLTGGNASGTWSISITGNAGTVTNGVYTSATYSNPSWITSLAWSKITSTPTTLAGYGITDAYTQTQIQNFFSASTAITGYNKSNWDTAYGWGNHASAGYLTTASAASTYVSLTGSYANPSWITSLAWSKITGAPAFLTSYTETDTLATVTGRGASTTSQISIDREATINTTTPGTTTGYGLHFGGQATNDRATGITFSAGGANGANANAGIYVQGSGSYGTRMHIATTDSYATGSKTAITINESGVANFLRARPQHNGSNLALISEIPTNLNQLTNGPGYITGITGSMVTTALGYTPIKLTAVNELDGIVAHFRPATAGSYTMMKFESKVNQTSDYGWILVQDDSNFTDGAPTTEDIRMTIGVFNDFQGTGTHSDELWLQGGARLVQNIGSWDSELNTIVGTPAAKSAGTAYEWRVNNSQVMRMTFGGELSVGGSTVWTQGNLTNLNQLTNGPGYITGYTETDTLATVTGRGASTATALYLTGGSSTVPALHIRSGGSSWSEGLAVHPSSNDGYALTFYRTKSSYTDQTNTWALGNLGESGNVNHFGLLRKDLTGGVANGQTNAVFTINPNGVFKFGFSPLVGSNSIWHAGNDGSGSGLDADLLDGYHASGSVGANTVVIRDGNGYIYANYINTNIGVDNPSIANFITDNGDGWMRKSTIAHVRNSLGNYGGWLTQAAADPLYVNVTGDSMTGPLIITGSTSGQELLAVNGINGRLFTVTDDLSNSLFSVNTIAGLPVIEAFADNSVKIGPFSAPITINSSGITTPSHGTSANWWTAFNKRPASIAFSGSSTKTLTLTLGDGSTLTANFNDIDTDTNTDQQTLSISGQTLTISNGNSVTIPSGTTLNGTGFVRMSGTTVSYVTGTSSQFVKADGSLDGSTYVTSSGNVATVGGLAPAQFFNNMGQSHGTRTSFDVSSPSYDFGFRFVQGSTNGPGTGGSQYYSWYIGLGSDYPATGGGSYGAMFAVDRNTSTPYLSVRYNENNNFSSWRKVAAGYADSAGSVAWTNVTSRPTALSQFTNDLGNYGGFLTALPSHTHDDRYYTESESDGRFQPLENQRLSTGNAPTFGDVYVNSWFRNNSNNTGLYNQNTTQHWSSNTNGYWDASSTTTVSAIRLYTGGHVSALRGGLYANNSNQVGIIDSNQAWRVRATTSGGNLLGLWGVVGSTQGSDTFFVDGVNGRLLTVTDDMSDSIFSANTISGLPVIEAFADYSVKLGVYNQFNLVTSGNRVAINSNTVDPNWAFYVTDRTTATSRYTLANPGMGFNLADNYAQLQLYGPSGAYIDFTQAASDYQGRIMWNASKFTIGGAMWGDMYNASGAAYATQSWVSSQGYLTSLPAHSHTWTSITSKPAASNWNTNGNSIDVVVGMLSWKNYGDNHVIFDASRSTSPTGSAVNNTNPDINWTGTYPTLMGWNGSNTYGVRVDVARYSDSTGSVAWTNVSSRPTALSQFTNDLGNYGGWITSSGSISGSAGSIAGFNNPTTAATASTIVYRDTSGHITGNYIFGTYANFSSGNSENPTIGQIWTQNTSDNYLRKSTPAHFRSQIIDGYYLSLSGGTVNGNITENGNLTVNGVITENSSIRYKTDIETIPNALSKVLELRGVSFLKIGSEKTELGLIAEEVAQVVPEIVQLDESGRPDAIAYPRLVALLVESIKDLNDQIQKLTAQVNAGKQ